MGTRREFACPGCGYRAVVSGGDDCGFFVATRTAVCTAGIWKASTTVATPRSGSVWARTS